MESESRVTKELWRLSTFAHYPSWAPGQPEALAAAGFYYSGHQDEVTCGFCQGVLGAWERGDDPMREHRRHFPHCPFIRGHSDANQQTRSRGLEITGQLVTDARTPGPQRAASTVNHEVSSSTGRVGQPRHHFDPRDLRARVDGPIARLVMDRLGVGVELVREAIYHRLQETGEGFSSAEELTVAVLYLMDT